MAPITCDIPIDDESMAVADAREDSDVRGKSDDETDVSKSGEKV